MYRLLRRPFRLPFFSLRAALLAAPLLLGGCIPYPAYKTLQPQARATVIDEQSRPLADARVILITSSYPYGRERWRDEQRSGEDGVASFENHSEWRAESLMIHGRTIFFWNWCVEKPGYATYRTLLTSSDDFDARPTITLTPGSSQTCDDPGASKDRPPKP